MFARSSRYLIAGFSAAVCLALAVGCGGGAPPAESSLQEATVRGKITVKGKPATKGTVVFDPRNINRREASIATTDIGSDGTYEATTAIGRNSVSVIVQGASKGARSMSGELGFEVESGDNTLDIDLPLSTDD